MAFIAKVALRNLGRQRGRHLTLGSAIALGCAIMTVASGTLSGMRASLREKAAIYYGGDCSLHGLHADGNEMLSDAAGAMAILKSLGGIDLIASPRIVNRSFSSYLFFAGASIQLKVIIGVDWDMEGTDFRSLNFVDGGIDVLDRDIGVLISEPVALALGARLGDDLLVLSDTVMGQRNTGTAIVSGIFRDSSFLGADTIYVGIEFLRGFMAYPEGAVTEIGIRFTRSGAGLKEIAEIQKKLEAEWPMFPLTKSRAELFNLQRADTWDGERYALLSLAAHIAQIEQITAALAVLLYGLVAMLLGIVVFGVVNTYRVITYERTREIGTMRALGLQRSGVARLFLFEAALLAGSATAIGMIFGVGILSVLGSLSFSWIPGFDVFLSHGRIAWNLSPGMLLGIAATIFGTCLLASWGPAAKAARIEPAAACAME